MVDKRVMLEEVLDARERVETLKAQLDLAKEDKEKSESKLIEVMDLTGEKSVRLETKYGIRLIVRKDKLYVSVKEEDREQLLKWVDEDCGRSDMIKPTIHNKTLESFINQRIKDGEAVPAFVTTFFKAGLTISSNGKKE